MKILFVHNNFPAQFIHIASRLARDPDNQIAAIGSQTATSLPNVTVERYTLAPQNLNATHPFARTFDLECRRAEQVLYAAFRLKDAGFSPETIVVHSGWGENMPLREVFPRARFIVYCEFFYRPAGQDVDFDPEFPSTSVDGRLALKGRNANALLALVEADAGISPTPWQRSTYPQVLQDKITVIHEGVDTQKMRPDHAAVVQLASGRTLRKDDEIVTFVARNLEPLRGYHVFMRALPRIMAACPKAEILIVGADGVSYGLHPPAGETWKKIFLREVDKDIDHSRVHYLNQLPHAEYLRVLQVSSAHVYLTYPFVLSWSLVEAMSVGCPLVASHTGPIQDVLDERSAVLVPFLDSFALADAVIECLRHPARHASLGASARRIALEEFDLSRHTLPRWEAFLRGPKSLQTPQENPRNVNLSINGKGR